MKNAWERFVNRSGSELFVVHLGRAFSLKEGEDDDKRYAMALSRVKLAKLLFKLSEVTQSSRPISRFDEG